MRTMSNHTSLRSSIRSGITGCSVLALALLLQLPTTGTSFAQGSHGGGFVERHSRVEREVERTRELWEEVSGRVERTSAAPLRTLVERAAEMQSQAQQALEMAETMNARGEAGRADDHLRNSLALTLRARDMTTRAARQLREELSQEESARRTLERVRVQHERLRQNEAARRSPLWDQATQLLEQARQQWRENNFEQALRLAQNASSVLEMLEQRTGTRGADGVEQIEAELQRTEEMWQRLRERAGDRSVPQLDQAQPLLREARQELGNGRSDRAAELVRAARRLLAGVDDPRDDDAGRNEIGRALDRLDVQIERFAERIGDEAPAKAQRLLRQAMDERDRARRAVQAGNEGQARQHVRAAADLLARIQKQLGGRG